MINVFKLEYFLLDWDELKHYYREMPQECKNIFDLSLKCFNDKEFMDKVGGPVGIGYHDEVGWFILGGDRGPCLLYSEKGEDSG